MKIIGLNWSLYTRRLFIFKLFLFFALAHFAIMLVEYKFMTHGTWNFMEESEPCKATHEDVELIVTL